MEIIKTAIDILQILTPVLVAIIGIFQYQGREADKRAQERQEARDHLRQKGCLLQLKLTDVTKDLSMITAKKMMEQKTNGEVERAFEKMAEVEAEYDAYLRETAQMV